MCFTLYISAADQRINSCDPEVLLAGVMQVEPCGPGVKVRLDVEVVLHI